MSVLPESAFGLSNLVRLAAFDFTTQLMSRPRYHGCARAADSLPGPAHAGAPFQSGAPAFRSDPIWYFGTICRHLGAWVSWLMDRSALEDHLAAAERHLDEAERQAAIQRELVAELERNGLDTAEPARLLAELEEVLTSHAADCDRLRTELGL